MRNNRTILLAATALTVWSVPAAAQTAESSSGNDIIVTAQRIEQRLQDVPISITVLDSATIANNNISSAKDIAAFTPGLTTNNRYGVDNTTWTIRGFTQEQRTTSTVGTYFADVVALRGSGGTQGGDGAGPGNLFDLQNIQVLKGPQGTLFGRNSTGGAVLLVPRRPTDQLEGYVEGSVGSYDLRRFQAVVNVPLSETFKVRLGVDRQDRDGYLKNAGNIGFGPYGNAGGSVDYWAFRLSVLGELTPDLENYMVASVSQSESTGVNPKINRCFLTSPYNGASTGTAGANACAQMTREAPLGFWSVSNALPDVGSRIKQWQVINTTTWTASDTLTIKNTASYGEFLGDTNLDLFGYYRPIVTPGTETSGLTVQPFNTTHALPGEHTNAQSSLVEELQFQGNLAEGKLTWQGGLYLEVNSPIGRSGILSQTFTGCSDIDTFTCVPLTNGANSLGRLGYQWHRNKFVGKAAYFQASYDLSDKLKLTGGIRYTQDTMTSDFALVNLRITSTALGNYAFCNNTVTFGNEGTATNPRNPLSSRFSMCQEHHRVRTSAPTWLLGLDFKPVDDILLYAKWSRGYRQGGIAAFGADRLQDYADETVDTYELGAKTSWRGAIPGYFNIAGFYNDFRDQQLQIGLSCNPVALCAQTTAIINAGKSTLKGLEAEAGVEPFEGLKLQASYAYLKTEVKEIIDLQSIVAGIGLPFNDVRGLPIGSAIPNSMPHKLMLSGSYTLPLDESVGRLSVGATWVYSSKYRAVSDPTTITGGNLVYLSNYGVLPSSKILNLNATWEDVAGLPIDASVFATNVTKEKYYLHANVQASQGFVTNIIGEPRMWGVRLKVKFGQ